MNKLSILSCFITGIFLFSSVGCEKNPVNKTGIIFKIDNKPVTKDTVNVQLGGYQEVIIEANGDRPQYFRQKNSETPENLDSSEDLRVIRQSHGSVYAEKAEIYSSFPDSLYQKNDIVRIKVQVQTFTRSLYYLIE